jgi:RNAse (barnase) inhibitor barstar
MTTPFVLIDDPTTFRDVAALIVRVPRGIRSKEKLFGIYANSLRLPKYFGRNWDALEECLRDLSWLPPTQAIAIIHQDLPFGPGGENRAIYLDVLRDVLDHWSVANSRSVQVIFPSTAKSDLTPEASEPR